VLRRVSETSVDSTIPATYNITYKVQSTDVSLVFGLDLGS